LDLDPQGGQRAAGIHADAEFGNVKTADHAFQGGGVYVVAPNLDHIIRAAKDATLEAHKRPAAWTRLGSDRGQVAGPIADQRTAQTAQRRDHELTDFTGDFRLSTHRIDHFDQMIGFYYMQTARVLGTFNGHGAGFGGTRMIEDPSVPGLFDALAGGED